jgi:ribosomal protein S10
VSIYGKLTGTTAKLLDKSSQGVVEIGSTTSTPGANPWDAPTIATQWQVVNAVVRGVSAKYVDGVKIVSSDRQVLLQGAVDVGDLMRIDGIAVAVLRIDNIPAAGDPVATRVFVRG